MKVTMRWFLAVCFLAMMACGEARAEEIPALDWVKKLEAERSSTDELEVGAAMHVLSEHGSGDGRKDMMHLKPEFAPAHGKFADWLKSEGQALVDQMQEGTLDRNHACYEIIKGVCMDAYWNRLKNRPKETYAKFDKDKCKAIFEEVKQKGVAALKKGYLQKPLSEEDVRALQEYRMLDDIQNSTTTVFPYHRAVGLGRLEGVGKNKTFNVGDEAPDFTLPRFSWLITQESYQGVPPVPNYTDLFHLKGALKFIRMFPYYEPGGKGVKPREMAYKVEGDADNYVRLSDLYKEKPVILMVCRMIDGYWYRVKARDIEPLINAYGNKAHFLIVNTSYNDDSAGIEEMFGKYAGKEFTFMFPESRHQMVHEALLAQMRDNFLSIPVVIDNVGSTVRNDFATEAGDAHAWIIDTDGKVAFDYFRGILNKAEDYNGATFWANLLETELRKVLENGGKAVTPAPEDWMTADISRSKAEEFKTLLIPKAKIESIDPASGVIVVKNRKGTYTLHTDDQTRFRFSRRTTGSDIEERAVKISDLSQGDKVEVLFYEKGFKGEPKSKKKKRDTTRMNEHALENPEGEIHEVRAVAVDTAIRPWERGQMFPWLTGEIVSVNGNRIKVKPDLSPSRHLGYQMCKQFKDSAKLSHDAEASFGEVDFWHQNPEGIEAIIDRGVDIFLDGKPTDSGALKKGLKVGVCYHPGCRDGSTVYPEVIRVSTPTPSP